MITTIRRVAQQTGRQEISREEWYKGYGGREEARHKKWDEEDFFTEIF